MILKNFITAFLVCVLRPWRVSWLFTVDRRCSGEQSWAWENVSVTRIQQCILMHGRRTLSGTQDVGILC